MLNDNYTIRETKRVQLARNSILTVVLLFLVMQVPAILVGIGYGIFVGATDPNAIENMANFKFEMTDKVMVINLFMTLLVTLAVYLFAKGFLKRNNESLGLCHGTKGNNYLKGLAIGFVMLAGSVLVLKMMGMIELRMNLANVSPLLFILFVIGWIFQGFEEEFVTRSVLMNFFAAKNGVMVGIIANSLIFSLLHLGNDAFSLVPFINILLVGILYSLLFYVSDDIFLPAAAHSMWNFAQGNIFGISVSGSFNIENSLIKSKLVGNPLLTGGDFGVEGGLVVTIIHVIAIAIVLKMIRDKKFANLYNDNDLEIQKQSESLEKMTLEAEDKKRV